MFIFTFINYYSQAQTIEEVIKDKIEKGKESGSIIVDGFKLYDQDSMPTYYQEIKYRPIWTSK